MLWSASTAKRRPPGFIEPCIPSLVSKPPEGSQWIHEIKHDGYRMIACKQADRVRLFTRRGYDWTERYPLIRKAVAAIRTVSAVIDGEAVCCDEAGVAIFDRLHSRVVDHAKKKCEYSSTTPRPRFPVHRNGTAFQQNGPVLAMNGCLEPQPFGYQLLDEPIDTGRVNRR